MKNREQIVKGDNKYELTFTSLTDTVLQIHDEFAAQASRAVNASLTLRNWLIGFYIREYEQNGKDRAKYGDNLLERLSAALLSKDLKRMDVRELRRYRQFYMVYPQIRETLTPEFTARFQVQMKRGDAVSQIAQPLPSSVSASPPDLVQKLSFSQEGIGQLNTYVNWYRKNMMTSGDNPPVGILLCTDKNHALVEYVLAGMDNNLFVSKYQLELPKKEDMQRFIEEQLKSEVKDKIWPKRKQLN